MKDLRLYNQWQIFSNTAAIEGKKSEHINIPKFETYRFSINASVAGYLKPMQVAQMGRAYVKGHPAVKG
jgi:N-dimethylarginine dimethylaminohydrolase